MTIIKNFLSVQPAAITAAVTATLSLLLFVGVDETVIAALLAFVTAWLLVLRQMVTPNAHVALTHDQADELEAHFMTMPEEYGDEWTDSPWWFPADQIPSDFDEGISVMEEQA